MNACAGKGGGLAFLEDVDLHVGLFLRVLHP